MMEILDLYCGAIILWTFAYFYGKVIINEKRIEKSLIAIRIIEIAIFSILLVLLNIVNLEVVHGIFKILAVYLLQCMFFKCIFKENISNFSIISLIWTLCLCISEVLIALIVGVVLSFFHSSPGILKNTILINCLIGGLAYIFICIFRSALIQFINNKRVKQLNILLIITILLTISFLLFRDPVSEWIFNTEFIVTMSVLFGFCIITLYSLKQKSDIQKTTSMYQQVVKYSNNTNKLLEDYRMVSHEHKNQLSIIRQMVKNTENKELVDYIDNLISKRNNIKYKWVADLNHIPLDGLKGLINYKLLEMDDAHITSAVTISKDIAKIKLNKLSTSQQDHLYSIIGVYLDNAIQAAKESKKKEISLEIFKEKKDIVMIIANTYKGTIQLDKLDHYGYTTKGKNHGVGLHIVRTILNEDNLFSQSRKLIDAYYIQELRIHTDKLKTKK